MTDDTGTFESSGVAAGRYLVGIYKDGYRAPGIKPLTVVGGGDHFLPRKMHQKRSFFQRLGNMFGF